MENKKNDWAIVRLATIKKKEQEKARMLFSSVTLLSPGRPLPAMDGKLDVYNIKKTHEVIYFRQIIQSKEDAVKWYRSLGSENDLTPVPTRECDQHKSYDGIPFDVSILKDDLPWPTLGLPIQEAVFSCNRLNSPNPAPFIGSIPSRLHRRFGDNSGYDGFLFDENAHTFIARRFHFNLAKYSEYLGSIIYISPDPIVRKIENFMVPSKDGHGERIIYRVVPHLGQSLIGLKLTAFDKEYGLLTSFKTYELPDDGILEVDKGVCIGDYGFALTHDVHGVLAFQSPVGFLRQMNVSMNVLSNRKLKVNVPETNAKNSKRMEYEATTPSESVSQYILGKVPVSEVEVATRINQEETKRKILAEAEYYGQRWFPEKSRLEAASFIRDIIKTARKKIIIVDPYLGALQISQFLFAVSSGVSVSLITTKNAFDIDSDNQNIDPTKEFEESIKKLTKLHKITPITNILPISKLHDRFLVIDENVWFVGNSLNSLGDKASMIVRLPNPNEVIERLEILASTSQSFNDYKSEYNKKNNHDKYE